jgi:glycosyltransferase involved in cell wall biosynthesis
MNDCNKKKPEYALTLIVPMYNESRRIAASLEHILEYIERRTDAVELLLVDDGSEDDTVPRVRALIERRPYARLILLRGNRGKGATVREGALAARGARIVYMDADLSVPLNHIADLERALDSGLDVVAGSRHTAGGAVLKRQPFKRELAGAVFRFLVRIIVSRRFRDTQCGFKGFTRKAARELFSRMTIERFSFDVELLFMALKMGYRVGEAPVSWYNNPDSTLTLTHDAPGMVKDLFRIRWNFFVGKYNIPLRDSENGSPDCH